MGRFILIVKNIDTVSFSLRSLHCKRWSKLHIFRLAVRRSVLYTSCSEVSHRFTNVLGATPWIFKTVLNVWRKNTWSLFIVDILFVLKITLKLNLFLASLFLTITLNKSKIQITNTNKNKKTNIKWNFPALCQKVRK